MSSSNYTFKNIKKLEIIVHKRQETQEIRPMTRAKPTRGNPTNPILIESLSTREIQVTTSNLSNSPNSKSTLH